MELYLIRHGETEANVQGLLQGQTDSNLTIQGVEQAKKLGLGLAKFDFDQFYCSTLQRTRDTLEAILPYHSNTEVKYVNELLEMNLGLFENYPWAEFTKLLERQKIEFSKFNFYGGESVEEKDIRVMNFLKENIRQHSNMKIAWIAHGGVIFTILKHTLGLNLEDFNKFHSPNASVSILEFYDLTNYKVKEVNSQKYINHLL